MCAGATAVGRTVRYRPVESIGRMTCYYLAYAFPRVGDDDIAMHDLEMALTWLSHCGPRIGGPNAFPSRTGRIGDYLHQDGSLANRGNVINRSPPRARLDEKARPIATKPMRSNR